MKWIRKDKASILLDVDLVSRFNSYHYKEDPIYPVIGDVVWAAIEPASDEFEPAIIYGKVVRYLGGPMAIRPYALMGDVAIHHGPDWYPGDICRVTHQEVYEIERR